MIECTNRGCVVFVSEYVFTTNILYFFPQTKRCRPSNQQQSDRRNHAANNSVSESCHVCSSLDHLTKIGHFIFYSIQKDQPKKKEKKKVLTDVDDIYTRNISKYKIISQITKRPKGCSVEQFRQKDAPSY